MSIAVAMDMKEVFPHRFFGAQKAHCALLCALLFFGISGSLVAGEEHAFRVWISSDIEGYLVGCDCPGASSAGLSSLAAALQNRRSSREPLLDAGGFREPNRSDFLLEDSMDQTASLLRYTGMLAVSSDLRDGGRAMRQRSQHIPLRSAGAYADALLFTRFPGERSALILSGEDSEGQRARIGVAQWAGSGERNTENPRGHYYFGSASRVLRIRGYDDADFRILVIRGSLADAELFFSQAGLGAPEISNLIDLLVFTGPDSPAAALPTGGATGQLDPSGISLPWMAIAPRGNGLGRVDFFPSGAVDIELIALERGVSAESDEIIALGDHYMENLIARAQAAADTDKSTDLDSQSTHKGQADLHVDYWYPFGCRDCEVFLNDELPKLARDSGKTVAVNEHNTNNPEDFGALLSLLEERGIELVKIPIMVASESVWQGEREIERGLEALLAGELLPPEERRSTPAISARWEPGAVALAGLLDGVNPCAFSAMLFLVSAMAIAGRSKKTMLAIGLFYAAGVFITYSLIGAGLLGGLRRIAVGSFMRNILESVLGAILIILGILSFIDGLRLAKGRSDLILKLPDRLTGRVHRLIRDEIRSGAAIGAAFMLGVAVALIELGCTGQVYLPTIAWMIARGEGRGPWIWLLIYNGAFILPLLSVFVVAYKGVSAVKLAKVFRERGSTMKFIMAGLLIVLAAVLFIA